MLLRSYTTTFFYFLIVLILLQSCDEPEKKGEKDFQQNLSSFNNTMEKLDSSLNLMDSLQTEANKVEKERALGHISDEDAIKKLNQINNKLGKEIAKTSNFNPINSLPAWAKQLGLSEPVGMILDTDYCQSTS